MSPVENQRQFLIECGKHQIFGDAIETTKNEIIAMIPPNGMQQYDDEWDAALKNLDVYIQAKGGTPSPAPVPPTQETDTQVQNTNPSQPATISSEQQKAVIKNVQNTQAAQLEVSTRSEILKVLIDKPAQNTYIDPNMTVILPESALAKLQKYAPSEQPNHIDPNDADSVAAYKLLEDAIKNKTPLKVRVSDKLGSPVGVLLSRPQKGEGQQQNEQVKINKKHLTGFLSKDAFGHVPTGNAGLGAKLSIQLPRGVQKNKASAAPVLGTPVAKLTGVADAVKDPTKYEIISERDGNREKDGAISVDVAFKIKTDKTKKVNDTTTVPVYRTVRLRTTVKVPVWKRVDGIDVQEFGTGNRDSSVVSSPVTADDTADYMKLVANAQMSFMLMPAEQSIYGVSDMVDKLANSMSSATNTDSATAM